MTTAQLYLMRIETAYANIENAHLDAAAYHEVYRNGCITRDELAHFLAMHSSTLLYYESRLHLDFTIIADYL